MRTQRRMKQTPPQKPKFGLGESYRYSGFRARYPSDCIVCGVEILRGQWVVFDDAVRENKRVVVHRKCRQDGGPIPDVSINGHSSLTAREMAAMLRS
jgi:hypothetical protein